MPAPFPQQVKERALRLAQERFNADPQLTRYAVSNDLAPIIGIAPGTLAKWLAAANIPASPSQADKEETLREELKQARRELAELRRANEILKAASAFFAAELDRPAR